eukprot:SM000161S02424  [mRNA]  locus=s161:135461:136374:+ [translate_table: standard]
MGSLMAGWSSTPRSPKGNRSTKSRLLPPEIPHPPTTPWQPLPGAAALAMLGRRKSFTEDEVESFWAARRAAAAASDDAAAASSAAGGGDRHLATVPETVSFGLTAVPPPSSRRCSHAAVPEADPVVLRRQQVRQDGAAAAAAGPFTGSEPDNLSAAAKKAIVKDWCVEWPVQASPNFSSDYRSSPADAAGGALSACRWTRSNWAFLNDRPEATSTSTNANGGARGSLQHDLAARNTHASDHFSYHAAGSSTAAVSH